MRRRLMFLVPAAALWLGALPQAQAPTLPEVLERLQDYQAAYGQQYSSTIATEHYKQTSGYSNSRSYEQAVLESDFGIVRVPGVGGWLGFRDVYRVNGRAVQDRQDRLAKLFSDTTREALSQANQIVEEGIRFNIGPVQRSINNPALVLDFLDPPNYSRLKFSKDAEETQNRARLWVIRFVEEGTPTVVHNLQGEDEPAEGRIWVEPLSGRLQRADISVNCKARNGIPFKASLSVVFQEDARLHLWVPVKMIERYQAPNTEDSGGEATYADYRRFGVETKEEFGGADR